MTSSRARFLTVLMTVAVLGLPGLPVARPQGADGGAEGIEPLAVPPVWTDPLDDLSHVYVPTGGLVGVEVAGGEARLKAGDVSGWIASSVITCPPGYRFDLVYIEADAPGASRVAISILDASKEPSEVGYANECFPLHTRLPGRDQSVYDIDPGVNPSIRIQVNLNASGTDRPRLLTWTLFYVGLEEWHDDFLGMAKMESSRGINVTGSAAELNLSRRSTGGGDYDPYPAIAVTPWNSGNVGLFYPTASRDGYQDIALLDIGGSRGTSGVAFGDLNGDGNLDLVVSGNGKAVILWGDSTGTFSTSSKTEMTIADVQDVAVGDFNGDGEADLAFACHNSWNPADSVVFLNKGGGQFGTTADVTFTGKKEYRVVAGDLNEDGFDDVVFSPYNGDATVYYGGPDGPDTTVDITFGGYSAIDVCVKDLDGDEHLDVIVGARTSGKMPVFMGKASAWPATPTADYQLSIPNAVTRVAAGDLNGDGFLDVMVLYGQIGGGYDLLIFKGSAAGWSDANTYTGINVDTPYAIDSADLDRDGYDDIVLTNWVGGNLYTLVYKGGTAWPTTAAISKSGGMNDIAIAIPPGGSGGYRGTFTTQTLTINQDQKWDMLLLEGTTPKNTTMMVSVLDNRAPYTEVLGYKDLSDWNVDMGAVTEQSIHIKVTITSEFNWTTPALSSLLVKWMPKGQWRDEFYGPAKVERMSNLVIEGRQLIPASVAGTAPQLLFTSIRGDGGYTTRPAAYVDAGGLDYTSRAAMAFDAAGTSAADVADVNGDGFLDVVLAVQRTGDASYAAQSPLYLGTSVGFRGSADQKFPTTGASDVVMRDLNGDGFVDVVFAQETDDGTNHVINSTLFWGSAAGWNATPDVLFETRGASGVAAADLDGDGRLDLAFSCYWDEFSPSTDSMVFLQGATGFCGTTPTYRLPTKGARAVAVGDVDGDGHLDLAFANSYAGGTTEIDSYVYWGKAGGGFETAPMSLGTVGAHDVKVADLDGDGRQDLVFANFKDNVPSYNVDSYVYTNPGSRAFPADPSFRLPGTGATAVAVADLDGTGWKDIIVANSYNGTGYRQPSAVYLGGASGYPASPSFTLPTVGATDVLAAPLIGAGTGGYMSRPITPEDWRNTGLFHTFKYTATMGAAQSGKLMLIDAVTWDVLAETTLQPGTQEWLVAGQFWVKEHPSIRALVAVRGLDASGAFSLDDLWLNWTKRVKMAPVVHDLGLTSSSLYRMTGGSLWVNVTDEYDPVKILHLTVDHRLADGTGPWQTYLLGPLAFSSGAWRAQVFPRADAPTGTYDLRVNVTDSDGSSSGYVTFPAALRVLNNIPTAPEIRINPAHPVTTSSLVAEVVTPATDVETGALVYHYRWFKDGVLQAALATDTVISPLTTRGDNWSVEVRAFDGEDEGPAVTAWAVIGNAGPFVKRQLPNPEIKEDTPDDQWIDLMGAFEDPDGDPLTWSVSPEPQHITVTIDPATGKVTLAPEANWFGEENVTFIASDGQAQASQTVLVTVTPVDDRPEFKTVNGLPIPSDPVTLTLKQGGNLTIELGTFDVEGDALTFTVNSTLVTIDPATGEMLFQPGKDFVGTVRFAVTMAERDNPTMKAKLNFAITVENVNDPPADPRITNPQAGSRLKAEANFTLIGLCTDPDTPYGQVLNFSWYANGTLLGYGSSLLTSIKGAGTYNITLSVTDGEFTRTASMEIVIEAKEIPKPPIINPVEKEGGTPYALIAGVIAAICIIVLVALLLVSRRRASARDAEAYKAVAAEGAGAAVAPLPAEAAPGEAGPAAAGAGQRAGQLEEIVMEQHGPGGEAAVVTAAGMEDRMLTIKPQETEAASRETEALFKDMGQAEPVMSAEEQERMRLDNLKRKYANAIGRMPYGIPSPELKNKDWNELAALLATGQRRTLPDGKEVTAVEGRWYYSDPGDSSSFLKEHGAKTKAAPKRAAPAAAAAAAAPAMDKATLLAKLEERFILGEISEQTYKDLKRRLEGGPETKAGTDEWVEE